MDYLMVKTVHIFGAMLIFGTGLGSAYYVWRANRSSNVAAIAVVTRGVVFADAVFTASAAVALPVTGLWMAVAGGHRSVRRRRGLLASRVVAAGSHGAAVGRRRRGGRAPAGRLSPVVSDLVLAWLAGVPVGHHYRPPDGVQTDLVEGTPPTDGPP